jgi:hypothetical protein
MIITIKYLFYQRELKSKIFHYSYHHHLRKAICILSTNLKYDDLANYLSYLDFMDYDYVGAPWPVHFPNNVGNGGLSLRRKSKMIEIIDNHNLPDWHNEDGYFSSYENMKKPSHEEAGRFSVECIYNEKSFGIHKAWNHLHKHEVDIISKHIPSIYKLQELYDSYTSNDSFTIITDMKNIFPDA